MLTTSTRTRLSATAALAWAICSALLVGPAQGQSPAQGDVTTWSVERMVSTRGGPIPFGSVPPGGVRFDEVGSVHVLDIQAAQVYVFSSELVPLGTLGRRGRGPGEFIQPTLLGAGSGTVAVYDPGTSRVTVFEGGVHAWDATWDLITRGIPRRLEIVDGAVVMEIEPFPFRAPGVPQDVAPPKIVRVARDGSAEVLATFARELSPDVPPAAATPAAATQRPVIFAPSLHWTTGPGGSIYTSVTDRYQVELHDLTTRARSRFATRRDVSAAPITDAVRVAVREQTLRRFAENRGQPALSGLNEDFVRQSIADMAFADRLPLTAELIHGVRDLLLVQRGIGLIDAHSPQGDDIPLVPVAWDVFRRDGSYTGVVEFPTGFMPVDGFRDLVVGVREGELGEAVVEVFRISGG